MKIEVPSILSILVVGGFVLTTTVIALVPVLTGKPSDTYITLLKEYWSLLSSIMGLIIGYYFGKGKKQD